MSFECIQIKQEPNTDAPPSSNIIVNNYEKSGQCSENINSEQEEAQDLSKTEFVSIKIEPDIGHYGENPHTSDANNWNSVTIKKDPCQSHINVEVDIKQEPVDDEVPSAICKTSTECPEPVEDVVSFACWNIDHNDTSSEEEPSEPATSLPPPSQLTANGTGGAYRLDNVYHMLDETIVGLPIFINDEGCDYIVPDVCPPKTSNIYISDVSEDILSINSTVDGKYMCPICHKRFANKGNVQRHMLLHTREKLECNVCYRQFVKQGHYQRHLLTHSTEKRYKCDDCGKMFRTTSNLEQHKRIHLAVKPFECETCLRQFAVKANLVKHLKSVSKCKMPNLEPLVCKVCDKVFQKEFLLKSHLRRHSTEKPYKCDRCQMSFKYKSTLIRHVQLHNGIKPYSCKICRKKFTHAGLIKPHMRKHTGEKPYTCPVCNRKFAHKHNMQRHTVRHTKVKHLVCDICNKTFPKESRLKYHMRTHTKAKPFVCEVCGKKFSHRQNIIRHYSRKHPNDKYDCPDTDASVAKDVWEKVLKSKSMDVKLEISELMDVKVDLTEVPVEK